MIILCCYKNQIEMAQYRPKYELFKMKIIKIKDIWVSTTKNRKKLRKYSQKTRSIYKARLYFFLYYQNGANSTKTERKFDLKIIATFFIDIQSLSK